MRKTARNKTLILISTGLFIISITEIFSRFITITDFAKGSTIGIGVGLLLTAISLSHFRTAK
jgi:hypothetical protein